MLDALLAGAASVLVGAAVGHRLGMRGGIEPLREQVSRIEQQVALGKTVLGDVVSKSQLEQAIREAQSECHTRAANIANKGSAEVMEQMLLQLQNSLADCRRELKEEIANAVGLATAELITRGEVQNAFAQVAQIEAARIREQQEAASRAAAQQARIQEVFGTTRPLVSNLDGQLGELNAQLNQQLGVLQQRLGQIRGERPSAPEAALVDPGLG